MCIRDSIGGEKDGQLGKIAIARLRTEGLGAGIAQKAARFVPVSYTHLDVYKRQVRLLRTSSSRTAVMRMNHVARA